MEWELCGTVDDEFDDVFAVRALRRSGCCGRNILLDQVSKLSCNGAAELIWHSFVVELEMSSAGACASDREALRIGNLGDGGFSLVTAIVARVVGRLGGGFVDVEQQP